MHDSAHFGVNEAQVHTDSLTVRTKSLVLKSPPNLPEWGHNSGKRLKMVDFGSLASWCEPRATPCKPGSRECGQAPRTAQRPSDPRPMAPPALCLARRRASCDTKTKPQPRRAIRARLFDLCSQRKPVTHASRSQHVRAPYTQCHANLASRTYNVQYHCCASVMCQPLPLALLKIAPSDYQPGGARTQS